MFTSVHHFRASLAVSCALLLLCALPSVVRSDVVQNTASLTSATSTVPSEPTIPSTDTQQNPYQTEGIPGGGGVVGDFVVGPGKVDVTIKPGESKTVQMTVTNRTGERRIFNLSVEDATGSTDPNTGIVLLGDDHGPYSLKDYISFPAKSFELDHNQRARIPVTITIPNDAEPSGHYGSVLVNTVAIKADTGETNDAVPQSAVIARIGTLFFVTVPGEVAKEGALKQFGTVPEQHIYQSGPINFGILFENKGPIHLAPYGEIRITNMLGEEVGYVQLDPWFVLPLSTRLREVTWNRAFMFGRYTVTIQLNRSYNDTIDTMSFTFWVLPWKLVLSGFVAIFIVVFLIRAFFRSFEFRRKR